MEKLPIISPTRFQLIKGTFLTSKVARRLFTLFLIAALLPILSLAFFSLSQINQVTTQSIEKALKHETKSYGLVLLDRLALLDQKLSIYRRLSATADDNALNHKDGFNQITIEKLIPNKTLRHLSTPLSASEHVFLNKGKTLLRVVDEPGLLPSLALIHPLPDQGKVLVTKVNNEAIWGEANTFDESKPFCIYGKQNNLQLFCSNSQFGQVLQEKEGSFITTKNDRYFIASWALFLKAKYYYPEFIVVVGTDKMQSLDSINGLKKLLTLISILALVIVTFISIIQIRRYLTPIEALTEGIKRISHNDFSHKVSINTDDEFKQLGDSFNTMSNRISHQFEFMTTLSEIDQLMLNSLTEHDIIATTIAHANSAVRSKAVNIGLLNEKHANNIVIYGEDTEHIHGISSQEYPITEEDKNSLLHQKTLSYAIDGKHCPAYLQAIPKEGITHVTLVPIVLDEKLKALLILSFEARVNDSESKSRLRELGDRIAIALQKSAWDKQLYQQANYDHLTGLPNRLLLNKRLQQAVNIAQSSGHLFSVLFLDLDQFKAVNDSFGHAAGDSLLKKVAQNISLTLSNDVIVSRLGGDEFIILTSIQSDKDTLYNNVKDTAQQLLIELSKPFEVEGQQIHLSTSIGIATFPTDGNKAESLLSNADIAMYDAKAKGRNNFQFYSSELTEKALQKLVMKTDLHNALNNNEFEVYYQAKVCPQTNNILGAEALLRWNNPERGLISPFFFIPVAEETGLITDIGAWVLKQVCLQNKQWQDAGLPAIKISVNLSPKQFQQQDLLALITEALSESGLDAQYLDLEIIEDTAMSDTEQTIDILQQLKQLNLVVSIDDYGTGFSNLSYLKQFPVDTLKIDKSFIDNIVTDKGDQAIVQSTITLAHDLGLTVVAEGVEDHEQLAILKALDCDEIQGYYFSKPIPAKEFMRLLEQSPILI